MSPFEAIRRTTNRILGPEEDLTDILAKSARRARRQRDSNCRERTIESVTPSYFTVAAALAFFVWEWGMSL